MSETNRQQHQVLRAILPDISCLCTFRKSPCPQPVPSSRGWCSPQPFTMEASLSVPKKEASQARPNLDVSLFLHRIGLPALPRQDRHEKTKAQNSVSKAIRFGEAGLGEKTLDGPPQIGLKDVDGADRTTRGPGIQPASPQQEIGLEKSSGMLNTKLREVSTRYNSPGYQPSVSGNQRTRFVSALSKSSSNA